MARKRNGRFRIRVLPKRDDQKIVRQEPERIYISKVSVLAVQKAAERVAFIVYNVTQDLANAIAIALVRENITEIAFIFDPGGATLTITSPTYADTITNMPYDLRVASALTEALFDQGYEAHLTSYIS